MRKGYIYYILDYTNGDIYIGSVWKDRWICRKSQHKNLKFNCCSSKQIIKNNNYSFEILEENQFNSLEDLQKREQFYIDNNKCINILCAYNYDRRNNNREYDKNYSKNYHKKNQNKINQYKKLYRKKYIGKICCKNCKKEMLVSSFKKHYNSFHNEEIIEEIETE